MPKKMLSFEEIEALIAEASTRVFGTALDREAYHFVEYGQGWLIEIDDKYHIVNYDRNCEVSRLTFDTPDGIVFEIIRSWAFAAGYKKARDEDIKGRDVRRTAFSHEVELMGRYSLEWRHQAQARHNQILANNPYNDEAYK